MGSRLNNPEPNQAQANPGTVPKRRDRLRRQMVVEGKDDREFVKQENTLKFIGMIRSKFSSDKCVRIGTGAIIADNLILTVAHNVCKFKKKEVNQYKKHLEGTIDSAIASTVLVSTNSSANTNIASTNDSLKSSSFPSSEAASKTLEEFGHLEFAQWIEFYPAINGDLEMSEDQFSLRPSRNGLCYKVKHHRVHPLYITEAGSQRHDICILQLETPLPSADKIKLHKNCASTDANTEISIFGYPTDKAISHPEKGTPVTVRQMGAKGRFTFSEDSSLLYYKFATYKGQSGSPIFISTINHGKTELFCIGLHKSGHERLKTNIGIPLNDENFKFIIQTEESITGRMSKIQPSKLPLLPDKSNLVVAAKQPQRSLESYEQQIGGIQQGSVGLSAPSMKLIYQYKQAAELSMARQLYSKAIQYYQRFVKLIEELPQEQRNESDVDEYQAAMINLAKSYCEQKNYEHSLDLYNRLETKCKEYLSFSVQKATTILNNKGAVLNQLHQYEQALDYFTKAYELRRSKLGQENQLTYSSLQNVVSMRLKLGKGGEKNIKDYKRVLQFKKKKFGIGSPQYINTCANLGDAFFLNNKFHQFLQKYYQCFQRLDKDSKRFKQLEGQFGKRIHKMCRTDCSQEDMKFASEICQKNKFQSIDHKLQQEWSKRNEQQTHLKSVPNA